MNEVRRPRRTGWPLDVAGDKGYSYPRIRRWLERRTIEAVIPQRGDQRKRDGNLGLNKKTYKRRSIIECCVGWLKECRRIGTRFDKFAVNFMAFVQLAFIQRYLRLLDLSDRT